MRLTGVAPAQAGVPFSFLEKWVPAFAGTTQRDSFRRNAACSEFLDYFFAAPCFLRSPAGSFTIGTVSNTTLTSSLPTFCTRRM